MKKRTVSMLLAATLAFSVTACGNNQNQEESNAAAQENQQTETQQQTDAQEEVNGTDSSASDDSSSGSSSQGSSSGMLVAYFTYAENAALPDGVDASSSASIQTWNHEMTGNTGAVAHMISEATGADIFSIQTVEKYPDSYDATIDQGREEQNADARPELSTHIENLDSYDTIFLGFPNWWGDMPMAIYSFLDAYDLSGKTIVPFVTSGGSGFSGSISDIESAEPGATVQEGLALSDSSAMDAQSDVEEWLSGLGYLQ